MYHLIKKKPGHFCAGTSHGEGSWVSVGRERVDFTIFGKKPSRHDVGDHPQDQADGWVEHPHRIKDGHVGTTVLQEIEQLLCGGPGCNTKGYTTELWPCSPKCTTQHPHGVDHGCRDHGSKGRDIGVIGPQYMFIDLVDDGADQDQGCGQDCEGDD